MIYLSSIKGLSSFTTASWTFLSNLRQIRKGSMSDMQTLIIWFCSLIFCEKSLAIEVSAYMSNDNYIIWP